jgi:cob(I)alamin adenosyltransferase
MKQDKGLIIVNTGDGKGKTTAALGTAMRACGHGMRVLVLQFIKGTWRYGELDAAKRLAPELEIAPMGEGFVDLTKKPPDPRDIAAAEKCLARFEEAVASGKYDMIVLDEIGYALNYVLLRVEKVAELLKRKPAALHIILTGRNMPPEIIALADTVTEMKEIKHAFRQGVKAIKGIEF